MTGAHAIRLTKACTRPAKRRPAGDAPVVRRLEAGRMSWVLGRVPCVLETCLALTFFDLDALP